MHRLSFRRVSSIEEIRTLLLCRLLSGSFYYFSSCSNYSVNCRVVNGVNSYFNSFFNCYICRILSSSLLVAARYECYAEYNSESENDFLHFLLSLK